MTVWEGRSIMVRLSNVRPVLLAFAGFTPRFELRAFEPSGLRAFEPSSLQAFKPSSLRAFELRASSFELRAFELRASSFELRASSFEPSSLRAFELRASGFGPSGFRLVGCAPIAAACGARLKLKIKLAVVVFLGYHTFALKNQSY
jgi:hypothetical protein